MIRKDCAYHWNGTCEPNRSPDRCDGCSFYVPRCSKINPNCEFYNECKPEDMPGGCEGCPEYEEYVNELREKENDMDISNKVACDRTVLKSMNAIRSENGMNTIPPMRSIQSNLADTKEQLNTIEAVLNTISNFLDFDNERDNSNLPDKEIRDMTTHVSEILLQAERINKKVNSIAAILGC